MKPANELRSKFSRYWATSELSCWCLRALRAVAHSRLPSNGLVRKSKAPSRIASTATSTEPWAVITTHRAGQLLFGDLLQDVHAGHVGQLEIQQHHRRRAAQQLRQCLLAAIGPQHLVAILGQILFIDHRQTAGIFHQQDSRFAFSHGSHPCN